jgi:hypothetical protein
MTSVDESTRPAQAPPGRALSLATQVKFLREDWRGEYSGFDYTPYLPRDGQPGLWLPRVYGVIALCRRGYHATTLAHWREWRNVRCAVWEFAPLEGRLHAPIEDGSKAVGDGGRLVSIVDTWSAQNLRLFAADCAARVLHLFERRHQDDVRPREAIAVARRFARGDATAGDVSKAYQDAYAAADAAAAAAAAYAAAAERRWQDARLLAYLNTAVEGAV